MIDIEIPDLTRVRRKKETVHQDFRLDLPFHHLYPDKFRWCYGNVPHCDGIEFTEDLILHTFDIEDAMFISDFLAEWVDDKTRKELNRIVGALPSSRLENVYGYGSSRDDDGDEDEGDSPDERRIKREIRNVKKYIQLPQAFERAAEFSGTSEAANLLAQFSVEARAALGPFRDSVRQFRDSGQFTDKHTLDINWANGAVKVMREFSDLIRQVREIRPKLEYFRDLSLPFMIKTVQGNKIPVCKPVYLDPEKREIHIERAYNPRYFKTEGRGRKDRKVVELNVPNDVHIDDRMRQIYVHGPNNRGKSVYLNTAALNIHLPMNGGLCFAESCEISLPGTLFPCLDLGNRFNLSHFAASAHDLRTMLEYVSKNDMVFLDEHPGGAEPEEKRKIAKGINYALTAHGISFFHATNDDQVWKHRIGRNSRQVMRVADYEDHDREFKVWKGVAKTGYSMEMARMEGIDPKSALDTLDGRFGK